MTTKRIAASEAGNIRDGSRVAKMTTAVAWAFLGIGFLLCLLNMNEFNDHNTGLMVGIGFLVGSVHVYVIGTAIRLVHSRGAKPQDEQ